MLDSRDRVWVRRKEEEALGEREGISLIPKTGCSTWTSRGLSELEGDAASAWPGAADAAGCGLALLSSRWGKFFTGCDSALAAIRVGQALWTEGPGVRRERWRFDGSAGAAQASGEHGPPRLTVTPPPSPKTWTGLSCTCPGPDASSPQ